jgi:hypothetical protein
MSSPISNSEATPDWARWLAVFLSALGLGVTLVFAFVFAIDPYDSGRFGLFSIKGVSDEGPRTANASRARDPQFDSAIIGNSHGQLLKPAELSRTAGGSFVQLTVPGTGPREQLALLDFFVRHHQRVAALVIVTDESWCSHDPLLPLQNPFPFWLYGDSTLNYAGRLFSARSLGRAWRRLTIGFGLRKRSEPDGYWDYEPLGPREFQPIMVATQELPPAPANKVGDRFPAVALLNGAIRTLPVDVPIVLLVPPVFYTEVPRTGSLAAAEQTACNTTLKRLVAGRPNSNFIDYRVDNALTRDSSNFMDVLHYRAKIARKIEEGIAASVRLGNGADISF